MMWLPAAWLKPLKFWSRVDGRPKMPRKPRPVSLLLEPLETRMMPSVMATLPQRPSLVEGSTSADVILALFQPSSQTFRPLSGNDSASSSLNGAFGVYAAGSYSATVYISGITAGSNEFTLMFSGSVDFELEANGDVENRVYTVTSVSLAQSGTLDFMYVETNGPTDIDDAYVSPTSTSGARLDALNWQAFAWEPLALALSSARDWDLENSIWSSITVTVTGYASSSFNESGQRILSGTGTLDLGFGIPGVGGVLSYSYSGVLDYSRSTSFQGNFTLTQTGSFDGSLFTLSSSILEQNGTHTFDYEESGELTLSGDGIRTAETSYALDHSGSWGGGTYAQQRGNTTESTETFSLEGTLAHYYHEGGLGTYYLREEGEYENGLFSLGSLLYDLDAHGSYQAADTLNLHLEGDGVRNTNGLQNYSANTNLGGAQSQGLNTFSSTGVETYEFSADETFTQAIEGQGSLTLHGGGTMVGY
jgi:hypothetical protein